jgi:hypothetical protein
VAKFGRLAGSGGRLPPFSRQATAASGTMFSALQPSALLPTHVVTNLTMSKKIYREIFQKNLKVRHREGVKRNILIVTVIGGLFTLGSLALAGTPLTLQNLRDLETKQGALAEVKSLCDFWRWDLVDASAFVEKNFAGDKSYMVDKASVTDIRTGKKFTVGIVINKWTGDANAMAENSFIGFLQTGEIPHSNDSPNLDVN